MTVRLPLPALPALAALALLAAGPAKAFPVSDPLAAVPAELRVTLSLPAGFGILPDSARLRISATNPATGETARADDALAIAPAPDGGLTLTLADPAGAQYAALEAQEAAWRAARQSPAAQIDVAFTPCRSTPAADPAGPMSLALQPAPGAPRLLLLPPGTTLSAWLGADGGASLADCPG